VIAISSDHLWSGVAGTATGGLEGLALFVHVAESEIHDLELAIEVQQQILGLEVAMANA